MDTLTLMAFRLYAQFEPLLPYFFGLLLLCAVSLILSKLIPYLQNRGKDPHRMTRQFRAAKVRHRHDFNVSRSTQDMKNVLQSITLTEAEAVPELKGAVKASSPQPKKQPEGFAELGEYEMEHPKNPIECPRCHKMNPPEAAFCPHCGGELAK